MDVTSNVDTRTVNTLSISRYWLQRWTRGGWITRLFGRIYEPSVAQSGVESWICSLAESRASLTQSQDNSVERTTNETSGPTPQELFKTSSQQSSFLRMFQALWAISTNELGETLDEWATRLRRDYSRRLRSAQATRDSGSSYWPTATANHAAYSGEGCGSNPIEESKMWLTPKATDGEGGAMRRRNKLRDDAAMWPTPTQRDHKDGTSADTVEENALLVRAAPRSSLHSEMTTTDGHVCSPKCRMLNPRFVELHMGWLPGWTSMRTESIDSDSWETALSRLRQQLRSILSAEGQGYD